jgi:hypothetical protein
MGLTAGAKALFSGLANGIKNAAKNFTDGAVGAMSTAVKDGLKNVAEELVNAVDAAGDAIAAKRAFTKFRNDLDNIVAGTSGTDREFMVSFRNLINDDITSGVSGSVGSASTSTNRGLLDRFGEALNSPTGQKLLLGVGVFGGLEYIRWRDEETQEDRAACVAACLPSNWDEYQSNTSVELKYTTPDELKTLNLEGGPVCTAARMESPGCYDHCYQMCERLNPSFLSRYISPFTNAVTDATRGLGDAAVAGAEGAGSGLLALLDAIFGDGLGILGAIAAITIFLIIVVMLF